MARWIKMAFGVYFVVVLFILASPWTLTSLINRLEPWVGGMPWSIFSVFLFTFLACIGLAIYQTLDIHQ